MLFTGTKTATFENIVIPEDFGPVEYLVDDHVIKRFAYTQDDYNPWYFGESPFGKRIAHAAILANPLLGLFLTKYDPNSVVGLHTHEELSFHNPIYAGERCTLKGRYVEKYVRRGKGYVVMEAEARGEDGRLLVRHRGTEIMRVRPGDVVGRKTAEPEGKRVTGEYRTDVEPAARARVDLEHGTPIAPLVKQVRQDQMSIFSWVDQHVRNIHTDIEVARKGGLRTTVCQGEQTACYIAEMLTSFFGPSWFTSGWQSLKFINPVYEGDTLTAQGVVTGQQKVHGGVRLELEVWIKNQHGQMTAVGWASGLVDR